MLHFIRPHAIVFLITLGIAALNSSARAQDKKADVAKPADVARQQKEAIAANLKKADLTKATIVETNSFFVVGMMPEDKAKSLGAMLEKVVPIARKGLQYDAKDEVWKGKLAVYYLPETRDFKGFVRSVFMTKPDGIYYDVRSDTPLMVDPVEVTGMPKEADLFANTVANVAGAYLRARGATANLPEWLLSGFGRATSLRAEGLNSTRYQNYKKAAKAAATGSKGTPPAAIADLWTEGKPASADVVSASLVEYMAYGPGAENFLKLVIGFRPDENGNMPSVAQALEAAGWKETPMLEKAWQKWLTGK